MASGFSRRYVFIHSLLALSLTMQATGMFPANVAYADSSAVINLNNDGVKALNTSNFQLAITKFEAALKLDPNYKLARDNLAIAHNNYGLQLRNDPPAALKQFHQALYLNQSNSTTMQNVDGIIRMMGLDPRNFNDRVKLGDQARLAADFVGAIIEYSAACKLKDDPKIHIKLGDVYRVRDEQDKAIQEYQAAARAGDSADVEVKLGQAYQAKKDIPNAIAAYGKAIGFKSDDQDVQDALVAGWEEALKENPLAPENHIGLGQAFQYRGDFGQAEQEYQQAIRFSPGKQNAIASKLLAGLAGAKTQANLSKHVNNGVDLQAKKQYDAAIAEYKLALQADPRNKDADEIWVNIGSAYQAKDDYASALDAYNQALKIDPTNESAKTGVQTATNAQKDKIVTEKYGSGGQKFKAGDYDGAIADFLAVLKVNPNDPDTLFSLGASYQAKKDFDDAIKAYQQAIAANPKSQQFKDALAQAFVKKAEPIIAAAVEKHKNKDYDGAIAGYQQALQITPDNASLWFNIASAEYAKTEYQRAYEAYQKAYTIDPKGQVACLYLMGAIDENYNRAPGAMSNYQKYLTAAPTGTYAAAAKERFAALNKGEKPEKIKSEAQLAQEKSADDAYQEGVKQQSAKQYEQAMASYQKALQIAPNNPDYVFALGTLYQAEQKYTDAAEQYKKAIGLAPNNKDLPKYLEEVTNLAAGTIFDQASAKQTAGDNAAAIELYKQGLATAPKNARVWTNLGIAYQQTDQWPQARDAYQKAYELDAKGEIGDLYLMAQLDENANQGPKALGEYQNYLRQAPTGQYAAAAKDRVKALGANANNVNHLQTQGQMAATKAANDAYDAGVKLQQGGDLDGAIAKYNAAIQAAPKEAAFVFARGTAYQAKKDYANAITDYTTAQGLDPSNKDIPKYLAALREEQAGPVVNEAIQKQTAGDFAGAIELYKKALTDSPNNARLWTNLASAYQQSEDFANAKMAFQKGLTLDPKGEVDNNYFLGILDENASQLQPAINDYARYVQAAPKGTYAVQAQGRLSDLRAHPNSMQKITTKAAAAAQAADAQKSSDAAAAYDAAVKAQTANNLDEALVQYKKALSFAPNEATYWYGEGTAYQAKNDLDNAIKDYRKAVELNPKEATYKQTLQQAQVAVNATKAAPLVDSAIKKQTAAKPDLPGAIADYEAALRLNDDAYTNMNCGTAYQAAGNNAKALEKYRKAIQLDPKTAADAMYYAGTVLEAMKQGPAALKEYQNYVRMNPTGQSVNDAKARIKALGGK
ncbi:MAG TPA: tetratricopeptide repeat protein [Drouetiella sp.]